MPRLLVVAGIVALVVTGALLAWPQARGWWLYQRSTARILDVLTEPAPGGLVRLAVLYEYELPRVQGAGERTWQLSWRLGDAFFRPMPDPLVESGRVDQVVRSLLDAERPDRRLRTVFFTANDPVGSAFILDETAAAPSNRLQIGVVLVGIGLIAGLYAWRRSPP